MAHAREDWDTGRLEWFDRTPGSNLIFFNTTGVAPHAPTVRFAYTVSAGKKAFVSAVNISIVRSAAASASGRVSASLFIPDVLNVPILHGEFYGTALDTAVRQAIGMGIEVAPGTEIELHTADGSTGGTVNYVIAAFVTEFDL